MTAEELYKLAVFAEKAANAKVASVKDMIAQQHQQAHHLEHLAAQDDIAAGKFLNEAAIAGKAAQEAQTEILELEKLLPKSISHNSSFFAA